MSKFELKEQLPRKTRDELTRIEALDSSKRSSGDTDFLTSLAPYRTNRVIFWDTLSYLSPQNSLRHFGSHILSTDDILEAEGNTVPTGYSGFKHGAFFRHLDETGSNRYVNTGDNVYAIWSIIPESEVASPSLSASPSGSASSSASPSASPSLSFSASQSPSASGSASMSAHGRCGA